MNTIIRDWMPRQAAEADKLFQEMYGTTLAERFTGDKYQLMHIEMFPHHIIHAECLGGDIDLLCNRRTTVAFFLNWVLGHMADNRNTMLLCLGEEAILGEAHARRYGYGSEPVCSDGDDILTLEQLLATLEQSQSALAARLQAITPDELAREVESFLGTTTLGQLIFFLFWHESYHAGQTEYLRQLAGTDDKVI